ncbi:oxidoreductase [Paenibacillus ottowii]
MGTCRSLISREPLCSANRIDEYGGAVVNRVRLLVEVSSAIREGVGTDFTVGIRISQGKVNDHTQVGR